MTDISTRVSDKTGNAPVSEDSSKKLFASVLSSPAEKINQQNQPESSKEAAETSLTLKSVDKNAKINTTDKQLSPADQALLDKVEHSNFNYFVDQSDPVTGLTKDRSTPDSAASIAAVGFSLTAYPIGVERGWVSRQDAADYTLKVLNTLWKAPQGDAAQGEGGTHGFFYHFLDPKTGTRMWNSEVSTIDTTLLMSGVLFARDYFNGNSKEETEIRDLADKLYKRVDWTWALEKDGRVSMGWTPENGFIDSKWEGYNEAMILELLGMGSPTHPLPADAWQKYHSTDKVITYGGQTYIDFPPLFGHQYSESWVDFKGVNDAQNKALGFDYFENSRRAAFAQNYYADKNPEGFRGYSKLDWGLTACDGPGNSVPSDLSASDSSSQGFQPRSLEQPQEPSAYDLRTGRRADGSLPAQPQDKAAQDPTPGQFSARTATAGAKSTQHQFLSYSARGIPNFIDDGTIAPTAAAASIAFAPELVLPTLRHWEKDRPEIWSKDGFKDAFNPTAEPGKNSGWVDKDSIGIDQGPIVLMTENYRSGFVWNVMKHDPYLINGLKKAGFSGGWLDHASNTNK